MKYNALLPLSVNPIVAAAHSFFAQKREGYWGCDKKSSNAPFFPYLCVFNVILTAENIENFGMVNIIK